MKFIFIECMRRLQQKQATECVHYNGPIGVCNEHEHYKVRGSPIVCYYYYYYILMKRNTYVWYGYEMQLILLVYFIFT